MAAESLRLHPSSARADAVGRVPIAGLIGEPSSRRPIILLSALPRCGTNYLSALLAFHPNCRPSRIPEDFFLANSALLMRFCGSVADSWDDWWCRRLGGRAQLGQSIGDALLNFAAPDSEDEVNVDTRLILRSPTLEGIDGASVLFPDAQLLILVRNAPDTVESGHRSFGWGYDDGIRAWTRSVRRLLSFVDKSDPCRCRIVRFEDLLRDPICEMSNILEFLDLDDETYPFTHIDSVPVLGSSSFGRADGEPVHWRPVPKTDEFDPLSRAKGWPSHRQKRAAWLGGAERAKLGYPAPSLSISARLLNIAQDLYHGVRRAVLCIGRCLHCRPRLLRGRQGLYLTWRHVTKYL